MLHPLKVPAAMRMTVESGVVGFLLSRSMAPLTMLLSWSSNYAVLFRFISYCRSIYSFIVWFAWPNLMITFWAIWKWVHANLDVFDLRLESHSLEFIILPFRDLYPLRILPNVLRNPITASMASIWTAGTILQTSIWTRPDLARLVQIVATIT